MAVKQAAKAAPAKKPDDRIHGTVLHKPDRRVNEIVRKHSKSDIINLFNIDCCMLFRVDQAHMQFDMLQNYRPYILFDGFAEGVFLPKKMGLLFPNRCDQLDFRPDSPVPARMSYALSDTEIAVMAGNGLFNGDWSCQGRIINSVLEIPCKIDYYAVARTPLTFIEIQDRLSLHTSTMQTGYKTLAAAFLPYSAQKHNLEQRANLVEGPKYDRDDSEIRRRGQYEGRQVGFSASDDIPTLAQGASFVEVAQARIRQRLKDQMQKGDVLGVKQAPGKIDGKDVADSVASAVRDVQEHIATERERLKAEASQRGTGVRVSDIDAKLEDMAARMIYAGAGAIPMKTPELKAQPLVSGPAPDLKPGTMSEPLTYAEQVQEGDDKLHHAMVEAKSTANDIAAKVDKAKTRQQMLAERRAARAAQAGVEAMAAADKIREAMGKEAVADDKVKAGEQAVPAGTKKDGSPMRASASGEQSQLKDDILSGSVDFDDMFKDLGL